MHAGRAIHAIAHTFGLGLAARFAAPITIGHNQRVFIQHRRLKARPRAHIDADLFARPTGKQIGKTSKQREEEINHGAGIAREELPRDGWRIIEIHDPGTARGTRNQQPGAVLCDLPRPIGAIARPCIQLHARIAITFNPAFHEHEKISPDGLRAGETAPKPSEQ